MSKKEVTLEEAETRLKRRIEVNVFILGLAIGIVLAILAELAMLPVQATTHDGIIELAIGQNRISLELTGYYILLAIALFCCILLGLDFARRLYGLDDRVAVNIEHDKKPQEVAIKWNPTYESLGKIHGYKVQNGFNAEAQYYWCNFTRAGSDHPNLVIRTDDKRIRIIAQIDLGAVALAKTLADRLTGSKELGQ